MAQLQPSGTFAPVDRRAKAYPARAGDALALSVVLSCAVYFIYVILVCENAQHWCVVPVLLCGIAVAIDAVRWLRSGCDVFDPAGMIGLFGLYFFFLAPLLHLHFDYWMLYMEPPPDWRDWLGAMAILNAIGLLLYRLTRKYCRSRLRRLQPQQSTWRLHSSAFFGILIPTMAVSAGLQVWVYHQFGGIAGYIASFEDRQGFEGMGWVFMVSESFPILAMLGYSVWLRTKHRVPSWGALGVVLLVFILLTLLFGGLRGSRSHTIFNVFWAVGIIHFSVRRIPRTFIFAGCVFTLPFMYAYGFYKAQGRDGLRALHDNSFRENLQARYGRTMIGLLLGDCSRSDVEAHLLYRFMHYGEDYDLGFGRTYVGAVSILIPKAVWPDRPPGKLKYATNLQYGAGTYEAGHVTSRVFGMTGEALLNFGPIAVPLVFIVLGYIVTSLQAFKASLHRNDPRWLLLPQLVMFVFLMLSSDSDNLVFFLVKNGSLPFMVIVASSVVSKEGCRANSVSSRRPEPSTTKSYTMV